MDQQNLDSVQLLDLFISCRSLDDLDTFSVSDPFVSVFMKNEQHWIKVGQTELIWNNLNPNFATSIKIEYHFETQQHLRFEVHHFQNEHSSLIIGTLETTVSRIAGAKDQIFMGDLFNGNGKMSGKIIIKADQVKRCNDDIEIHISGTKIKDTRFWFWHGTNPFLRLYRFRKDDKDPILVYETEFLENNKSPVWKPIQCKSQKICNGDYQMPIKFELWDYRSSGNHFYLGETSISVQQLIDARDSNQIQLTRELRNRQKNEFVGNLHFSNFKLIEKPSFWDYLAGGQQLNMILAIDYTASNKNSNDPKSLHYINPNTGAPSQYLQAIISVGEIVINYDYDKKVPVYGFGCKPCLNLINTNQTLHCFPLNDNPEDPEVYGLDGIVQAYRSTLSKLHFDGPTYLHPIISEAMKQARVCKEEGSHNYLILVILTDGETHDLKASIDDIVASSHLPLSIIIIGIGDADFENMKILDNDDLNMVDSNGKKAQRDLVQFVPFNQFKGDASLLAKEVLFELPDQVVEYFSLVGIKPNPPNNMNPQTFYQQHQQYSSEQSIQSQQYIQSVQYNNQGFPQNQYYEQQPQQRQLGMAANVFGQGMARQGFLNNFIKQANSQYLQTNQHHQP